MNLNESVHTFNTAGWRESIAPAIHERMQGMLFQLASANRPKDVSDDMLRGYVAALNWVLESPARVNRALKALEDKPADAAVPTEAPPAVGSPHEAELE